MHERGPNTTEIHLPERWAVLEQALRQMNAEDAAARSGSVQDEELAAEHPESRDRPLS